MTIVSSRICNLDSSCRTSPIAKSIITIIPKNFRSTIKSCADNVLSNVYLALLLLHCFQPSGIELQHWQGTEQVSELTVGTSTGRMESLSCLHDDLAEASLHGVNRVPKKILQQIPIMQHVVSQ